MAVDQAKIREHIRGILEAIGEDPDREELRETPDRVARMYGEIFEGIGYTNDEIANMFNKTFEAPNFLNLIHIYTKIKIVVIPKGIAYDFKISLNL